MRALSLLTILLMGIGCRTIQRIPDAANFPGGSSHLRVRNGSRLDFYDIHFQGIHFGDLAKGQLSSYHTINSTIARQRTSKQVTALPGESDPRRISLRLAESPNRIEYVPVDPWSGDSFSRGLFYTVTMDVIARSGDHEPILEIRGVEIGPPPPPGTALMK